LDIGRIRWVLHSLITLPNLMYLVTLAMPYPNRELALSLAQSQSRVRVYYVEYQKLLFTRQYEHFPLLSTFKAIITMVLTPKPALP
jgi:hypothetical protein